MDCYACDREAEQRCPRCGNVYCPRHGTNFCGACLDPLHSAPSRGVFRVAIFGLFAGAVFALWLLIRPPGVPGEEEVIRIGTTATPALTPAGAGGGGTATPLTSSLPTATATAAETTTPAPTITATPAPTATPGHQEYIVQDNDTWFGISGQFGVDATELAELNDRTLDDFLHPGETLLIP